MHGVMYYGLFCFRNHLQVVNLKIKPLAGMPYCFAAETGVRSLGIWSPRAASSPEYPFVKVLVTDYYFGWCRSGDTSIYWNSIFDHCSGQVD